MELMHRSLQDALSPVDDPHGLIGGTIFRPTSRERWTVTEPLFLDSTHEQCFLEARAISPDSFSGTGPQPWVACLGDAVVWGRFFTLIDANGYLIDESFLGRPRVIEESFEGRLPIDTHGNLTVQVSRHVDRDVVLLGAPWAGSYYHWINDVLPRYRLVEELLATRDVAFLVPPLNRFLRASLDRIGVPADRLIEFDDSAWRFHRLYVLSPLSHHMSTSPGVAGWLRRRLMGPEASSRAPTGGGPGRRLYLTRGGVGRRVVRNEAALLRRLEPLGFQSVQCGELSFGEQVRLFSSAGVVLAPHGGALTNILFCPPGARVIDMLPENHVVFPFFSLSQAVGLQYLFLLAPVVGEGWDIEMPIDALEEIVYSFVEGL